MMIFLLLNNKKKKRIVYMCESGRKHKEIIKIKTPLFLVNKVEKTNSRLCHYYVYFGDFFLVINS